MNINLKIIIIYDHDIIQTDDNNIFYKVNINLRLKDFYMVIKIQVSK